MEVECVSDDGRNNMYAKYRVEARLPLLEDHANREAVEHQALDGPASPGERRVAGAEQFPSGDVAAVIQVGGARRGVGDPLNAGAPMLLLQPTLSPAETERRRRARRPRNVLLRLMATAYLWLAIPVSIALAFMSQICMWAALWPILCCFPKLRVVLPGRIFRFFNVAAAFYFNPFWYIKIVELPEDIRPRMSEEKLLWICNHRSAADPWVFSRAFFPWEMKWVYKADLQKIPVAGQTLIMANDHPLKFTKEKGGWGTIKSETAKLMSRVVKFAEKYGIGTVVFPEGTRSRSGRMLPFKDGFFKLAIEHKFGVVPVVSHNTSALWPLGSSLFGVGTCYIIFGNIIYPEASETVELFKRRVRNTMCEMLTRMPLYIPEEDGPLPEDWAIEVRGQGLLGKKEPIPSVQVVAP